MSTDGKVSASLTQGICTTNFIYCLVIIDVYFGQSKKWYIVVRYMTIKKFRSLVASNKFFYATMGVILVSCLLFVFSIAYRIPPDEYYHFRFIEYYATQPITDGPFISNQGVEHYDLRDITRVPNYLYHYAMSFPLRAMFQVTDSLVAQVMVLRLITLGIGVAGFFLVRRIFQQIGASRFVQHSILFLIGLTGMVLWMFSSINYDVPATFLYMACVSLALSILQGKGITTKRLALFCLFAMLCVLTKVTFLPFLAALVAITLFLKRKDLSLKQNLQINNLKHLLLILAVIVSGFLFVERIGGNIIKYQQIEVTCDKVHAYADCMQDDVFNRNETQLKAYAIQKAEGRGVTYQPYQFTQMWSTFMYERSHFYYGHEQMKANYGAKVLAVATAATFVVMAAVFRKKIAVSKGEKLLFWITLSYAATMYVFNAQTWLKFGQPYAFQGRYLFPIIPFLYYFCIKLLILTYKSLNGRLRQIFLAVVTVIMMLSIYTHLPLLVFYRGTEAKWYTDSTRNFHLRVQDGLRKINIKPIL